MTCYEIDGIGPVVDPTAHVHPSAVLIGDVIVGPGCYVGPCASLRGDFGRIELHRGVNVQDACVLHSFPNQDVTVEEDGHIGHGAVLHGCVVRRDALVGMSAVVMDGAEVGPESVVAAGAIVPAGRKLPPRSPVVGAPAKVLRSHLAFARVLKGAPPLGELAVLVKHDPANLKARHQLGTRLLIDGESELALAQFLEIMRRDRAFEDDLGRKCLIAAFDLVEDADLVSRTRRQMASMLF